ncbi:hypothetical protein HELRODRAFT_182711 [Helobdella robusta]|uniref:Uncharacterized protein n=1 Tax=Helobdella robusta TaxID=6412 RepID=T1FIM5_HELRO|nr:hypothetical protein HELRODRAFT_182711 [Helobdella robusta]ESN90214.1 hypothetical protein HELRODRAFT_182711 [Helobdella robusta]
MTTSSVAAGMMLDVSFADGKVSVGAGGGDSEPGDDVADDDDDDDGADDDGTRYTIREVIKNDHVTGTGKIRDDGRNNNDDNGRGGCDNNDAERRDDVIINSENWTDFFNHADGHHGDIVDCRWCSAKFLRRKRKRDEDDKNVNDVHEEEGDDATSTTFYKKRKCIMKLQ